MLILHTRRGVHNGTRTRLNVSWAFVAIGYAMSKANVLVENDSLVVEFSLLNPPTFGKPIRQVNWCAVGRIEARIALFANRITLPNPFQSFWKRLVFCRAIHMSGIDGVNVLIMV